MAYDLVIKNGRIVDGSGGPSFRGDVAVKDGIIVEVGKVSGPAQRVVDASGLAVSPGFIDNHTHFDAQVTWDPLCTSSCYHGVTSVIVGHCGLALAPCHPQDQDALHPTVAFRKGEGQPFDPPIAAPGRQGGDAQPQPAGVQPAVEL